MGLWYDRCLYAWCVVLSLSGPAVLLDSSLPPSAGIAAAHYQPVTSQPPTQTILGKSQTQNAKYKFGLAEHGLRIVKQVVSITSITDPVRALGL